jgi:formylglycine-generating enzyme required for sulfatase activity/tRNA A-37 threonylcarbamoyl transferase component Bud32
MPSDSSPFRPTAAEAPPAYDETARLPEGTEPPGGLHPSPIDLKPGSRPIPDYELVQKLGEGGFGQVWKARDPEGYELALKFIRLDERTGAAEVRALDVMKNIRHPHLLSVFRVWRLGNHLIIAMELGDRTLYQRLLDAEREGQPGIPRHELVEYLREAAKGLDHLHSLGVQHRDVKPQNFLLVGGSVKVADFGLAKVVEAGLASNSGSMTPAYAAPEFFQGRTNDNSDQYSLAVSYCQLRGGRLPFNGNATEMLYGHLQGEPDLSMLAQAEQAAVGRALAKKPEDRYPSCKAFAEAVAAAPEDTMVVPQIGGVLVPAAPETRYGGTALASAPPTSAPRPGGGKRRTGVALAAVMLVAVGGLIAGYASGWINIGNRTTGFPESEVAGLTNPPSARATRESPAPKETREDAAPQEVKPAAKAIPEPKKTKVQPVKTVEPVAALTLLPSKPVTLQAGRGATVPLAVRRENLAGPIALELEGLPPGVRTFQARIPAGEERTRLELTSDASVARGATEVTVIARSGDVRATGRFRLEVTAPAPPPTPSLPGEITDSIGMKLVLIPAGKFLMGSSEDESGHKDDEAPRHEVILSKPIYLGRYEVTCGQFRRFVEETGHRTDAERDRKGAWGFDEKKRQFEGPSRKYTWKHSGFTKSDEHPVVNVSWNDAVAFCEWLSKKEGKKYELPTEAEWEYACRAGTTTPFYSGDDPESLAEVGNVADATAKKIFPGTAGIAAKDGYAFTAPVGQFRPNRWGLCDMHGNAWEWCADWYDAYASGTTPDPRGPEQGEKRVLRGGSWSNPAANCRSANRSKSAPDLRHPTIGFRVVLRPE